MDSFYFNLLLGFQHVLDLDGLDHLFFIVVLVINHTFKMWKKTFVWVTFFTLGHTISPVSYTHLTLPTNREV